MIQVIERPFTTGDKIVEATTVVFVENGQQIASRVGEFLFVNRQGLLVNLRKEQQEAERAGMPFPGNDSEISDKLGIVDDPALPERTPTTWTPTFVFTNGEELTFEDLLCQAEICNSRLEVRRLCALNAVQIETPKGPMAWRYPKKYSRLDRPRRIKIYDREYLITPVAVA